MPYERTRTAFEIVARNAGYENADAMLDIVHQRHIKGEEAIKSLVVGFVTGDIGDLFSVGKDLVDGNYTAAAAGMGLALLPEIVEQVGRGVKSVISGIADSKINNKIIDAAENGSEAASKNANRVGKAYPSIVDPRTSKAISFPTGDLKVVPKEVRVDWGRQERADFIKEWYDKGFKTPEGGWEKYDIHHIRPREYGGTNDFNNLVPVIREQHISEFNSFWRDF